MSKLFSLHSLSQVPYTPHANAFELFTLFHAIQPKRVYPLIKRTYSDDQMSTIPMDILNDDCEIVDDGDFPEDQRIELEESQRSFLDISQDYEDLGDLPSSEEISDPISDVCTDDDDDEDEGLRYSSILLKTHTSSNQFQINAILFQ